MHDVEYPRRFIEVEFRPGGKRYTYHYDGSDALEANVDRVEILTRDGPGTFRVLGVSQIAPSYETKRIEKVLARPAFDPLTHTGDASAQ